MKIVNSLYVTGYIINIINAPVNMRRKFKGLILSISDF